MTNENISINLFSLNKKTILITGAASGIGMETAALAISCGASVIAIDNNSDGLDKLKAMTENKSMIETYVVDISNSNSVKKLFIKITKEKKIIDGLVHAAGVWFTKEDTIIEKIDDATWHRTLDINLNGTFYICREVVKIMKNQGSGAIVTLASIASVVGFEKLAAYSASKGAVMALTRSLAIDCAPKNIRVNCICPGVIETPMTAPVLGYSRPRVLPIGRLGSPSEIARVALFLCSDWSSYVVGASFIVDGGLTAA
jgi:NAD(P)-dependent dehydrogenase (short-subunit alcohol dehydrogenase family)